MKYDRTVSVIQKSLRAWLRRKWDSLWCSGHGRIERLGANSEWHVRTDLLRPGAVVISGGAGRDISFELELARLGCRVFLFDPSPTGRETMSSVENHHPCIEFIPMGLSERSDQYEFRRPADEKEGSFSSISAETATEVVSFRCVSVSDFIRQRGIESVDLLKIDIEGFEYGVLRDVVRNGLRPTQVCVEFHDFLPGIPLLDTIRSIQLLRRSGWQIFYKQRCDFSLVRNEAPR